MGCRRGRRERAAPVGDRIAGWSAFAKPGDARGGVSAAVLERALAYWRNVDMNLGDRIAKDMQT